MLYKEEYKVSDFLDVLRQKTGALFSNHLFFMFFIFFILIMGTFGIWVKPVLIDEFSWAGFLDSFNTLNLMAFSLPLLVTVVFDKVVTIVASGKVEDPSLVIWSSVLALIALFLIGVFFTLGGKTSLDKFSCWSLIAWFLVLYIWIVFNVENPNYQKKTNAKAATGGNDVNYADLED
ncbi:hypothetical protein [Shewanella algae]|uniref:hypothetical protein n=1 Tax=Shewanella algae TaxID=38313 RepID=UPI00313CDA27